MRDSLQAVRRDLGAIVCRIEALTPYEPDMIDDILDSIDASGVHIRPSLARETRFKAPYPYVRGATCQ